LDGLSVLGFSRVRLVAIDNLKGTLDAGGICDLEADGVLASREARDGHEAVSSFRLFKPASVFRTPFGAIEKRSWKRSVPRTLMTFPLNLSFPSRI
jgi:hypothetical protein